MNKLEELVRKVTILTAQKFDGGITPFFFAERDGHKRLIIEPLKIEGLVENGTYDVYNKERVAAFCEMVFAIFKIDRYVYVSEAWAVTSNQEEAKEIMKKGIREHPDRFEVIVYEGADYDGNNFGGHQSIVRPAGSPAYLFNDLALTGEMSEGRFGRLLDFRRFTEEERKNANFK